jgi:hypothetical protein
MSVSCSRAIGMHGWESCPSQLPVGYLIMLGKQGYSLSLLHLLHLSLLSVKIGDARGSAGAGLRECDVAPY